tara:strand:- start:771 stop:1004 length:234 start_codon:yes stop_codon:yes gene_type:complete
MGLIFRDERDDQQEALLQTTAVGLTWQYRYLTVKWMVYCVLTGIGSATAVALTDYTIYQVSDYDGIIGLMLDKMRGE